jgi:hypothetical protein
MKTLNKIGGIIAIAIILSGAIPQAHAGPGPRVYTPVVTMEEANALKEGDQIAVETCGVITLMEVDKSRSILHRFYCPQIHREFHVMSVGEAGKTHAEGSYVLVDDDGEEGHLAVLK